jgi:hypothetical protein
VTFSSPTTGLLPLTSAPSSPNIFTSSCLIACGCCVLCGLLNGALFVFARVSLSVLTLPLRYRYVTAVAAYLLLIPVEMLAQTLAPSYVAHAEGASSSGGSLPHPRPRSPHYIVGRQQDDMVHFLLVDSRAMQRLSCGLVSLPFLSFSFSASFPANKTIWSNL